MRPQLNQQQYQAYLMAQQAYLENLAMQRLCNSFLSHNDFLLKQGICHDDPRVRYVTALTIGKKERPLFDELLTLLDDEEIFVQQMARESLKKILKEDYGPLPGVAQCNVDESIAEWKKIIARNK